MAVAGERVKSMVRPSAISRIFEIITDTNNVSYFMLLFFLLEIFVNIFVISNIRYTEIDWVAYMQEVEGVINGTYDYTKLKGDTGPLVYPAGFVYVFVALYYVTSAGKNIKLAQYMFAVLYQLTLLFVFFIYFKTKKVPPYVLFFMCCASYRIHSIYVLRLFNDPVAMTIFYGAVCLMLLDKWGWACAVYSVAVSIKMNILLYAPGLFILLMTRLGFVKTFYHLALCALVQLVLGTPFLLTHPLSYVGKSFELSRQFLHRWTVNWRFLPEDIFLDRRFHTLLLILHIACLIYLASTLWTRKYGGLMVVLSNTKESKPLDDNDVIFTLFTCNFVGMCFSRSLHYQFYVWYFHNLHYLLWSTRLPVMLRLLILGVIELAWNKYPSSNESSCAMHISHVILLMAILFNTSGFKSKADSKKKIDKHSTNGRRGHSKKFE